MPDDNNVNKDKRTTKTTAVLPNVHLTRCGQKGLREMLHEMLDIHVNIIYDEKEEKRQ